MPHLVGSNARTFRFTDRAPSQDMGTGKLELFLLGIKSESDATTVERRVARLDGILSVDATYVSFISFLSLFRLEQKLYY